MSAYDAFAPIYDVWASDMTEDVAREVGVAHGLVDNKVCAIDGIWSGLRLVLRKELRPGRTSAAS